MSELAIVVAIIIVAFWMYALTKELCCHGRGLNRIDKNITSLVDTATLNDKTLDRLVDRVNKQQAQIDIIRTATKGARVMTVDELRQQCQSCDQIRLHFPPPCGRGYTRRLAGRYGPRGRIICGNERGQTVVFKSDAVLRYLDSAEEEIAKGARDE